MAFTISFTPGKVFASGEELDNAKLNQLGNPTATISGGGATTDFSDGAVTAKKTTADNFGYADGATTNGAPGGGFGGAVTKYSLAWTNNVAPAAANDGCWVAWTANADCQGGVTVVVGGAFGEKYLRKSRQAATATSDLVRGDIVTGQIIEMRYSATDGCWYLITPAGMPDSFWAGTDSGAANAYVVTITPPIGTVTSIAASDLVGRPISFRAGATNTGASTLAIRVGTATIFAALPLKKNYNQTLDAGDILANQIVTVIPDAGTAHQMVSPAARKQFDSGLQAFPAGGATVTVAHGLGVAPRKVRWVLECVTAEIGYVAGDQVDADNASANGGPNAFHKITDNADITNIKLLRNAVATSLMNKATGVYANITAVNWNVRAYAEA